MSNDYTPRVWVGCLPCYNSGRLIGVWVDAVDAGDVTHEDLGADCVEGVADPELWCFDVENMPVNREMSPVEASEIASSVVAAIEELGEIYPVFLAWIDDHDGASVDDFNDAYAGEYDSPRDFAMSLADDTGAMSDEHEWPYTCIDWDQAAREIMYDYEEIRHNGQSHIMRIV